MALGVFSLMAWPALLASGAMISGWIVVPVCVVLMLITAGHVLITARADMPASRRRIRLCSGVLMLVVTGLMGLALAGIDTSDRRRFVMIWMLIAAMVGLLILLALFDVLNTIRIARAEKRELDAEVARELAASRVKLNEQNQTKQPGA